jgi:hypothetical protein
MIARRGLNAFLRGIPMSNRPNTPIKGEDRKGGGTDALTKRHSNTRVETLRETYGEQFAAGHKGKTRLGTLLKHAGKAAVGELKKHKTSDHLHAEKRHSDPKKRLEISGKSVAAVANASVRFGAALKKLADE